MNAFTFDLPEDYNVSDILFDNLEAGRENKTAIFQGERKVTYGELAETASRVGHGLQNLGLKTGARVMLLLLDSPVFPAVFFGSIRAGYIPIPANTVLQSEDYAYLLQDSEAQVLFVEGSLYAQVEPVLQRCPALKHVIMVNGETSNQTIDWRDWLSGSQPRCAKVKTLKTDPAFWLYSSGSTGFPKGVIHLHRNIPFTVATYAKHVLRITATDITFSASKIFHAYGLGNNMTFPYSVGATTVLFPGRPTPEAIFEQIDRHRPTLFFAVPTLYAAMLAVTDAEKRWHLDSIRLCVSAAEALPAEVFRKWRDRFGLEILDGIGSTEMLHIFISNEAGQVKPGASGVLVPGYEAKILNPEEQAVTAGKSGDLFVQGKSVGSHYWRKPEASAKAMRGEWFFTGDRYYQDEQGFFFYDGRSDDMLKVGGLWVSPIEVENTLIEHPAVLESAVVAARDAAGLIKPKAYIVVQKGIDESTQLAEKLQDFVKSKIAPYKYPRMIAFVDELPKTATGKIQRFKLREV